MKKPYIAFLLVLITILMTTIAVAYWQYQETPNSTSNSGYNSENVEDGDWGTSAWCLDPGTCYYYANYDKPVNSTNESLWQVKYNLPSGGVTTELSITPSCWNYGGEIRLRYGMNYYHGGGGGGDSLVSDSLVITPTGMVPISQIQIGDLVLANLDSQQVYKQVLYIHSSTGNKTIYKIYFPDGTIEATSKHLFILANGQVIPAKDLRVGDILIGLSQNEQITQIKEETYITNTFDLIVKDAHNYYANGILVHNLDTNHVEFACDNGEGWQILFDSYTVVEGASIYEGAMWWDISETPGPAFNSTGWKYYAELNFTNTLHTKEPTILKISNIETQCIGNCDEAFNDIRVVDMYTNKTIDYEFLNDTYQHIENYLATKIQFIVPDASHIGSITVIN
jgi:hypothetical protein